MGIRPGPWRQVLRPRLRYLSLAISALAILVATLRPGGAELPGGWSFDIASGESALAEIIQNLLLFVPFGIGLGLIGVPPLLAIALGAGLSFGVEFAQQWIPGRDPSVGDLACNTASTAIGVALVRFAPRWLSVSGERSSLQALATAVAAVLIWLATGLLLRPLIPPPPYSMVSTPNFNHFGHYRGRVLSASTPPFPLSMGAPFRVTAVAPSRPPGRIAPLIAVLDARKTKVIIFAADWTDLVLRYHTRAGALTLEQPDMRWHGALRRIAPNDTFTVQAWRGERGVCMNVQSDRRCGFGYTVGDGWRLIFYPEQFPAWMMTALNVLWMAGLMLGVGYWGRRAAIKDGGVILRRRIVAVAFVVIVLGLLVVPLITGLKMTPVLEWIGAVAGIAGGWLVATRVRWTPADPFRNPHSAIRI